MNTETYEQFEIDAEALGDHAQWMTDGIHVFAEYFEGSPIGVELPNALVLEVVETAPVMKTATKTASSKPAKLSNGVAVNVPDFIKTGEMIRVNPNTAEYLDRAK
jgi:elongation factor P